MSIISKYPPNQESCVNIKCLFFRDDHVTFPAKVICQKHKHHKGSIYCSAWSALGDIIATGSNDKTIRMSKFNIDTCMIEGENWHK